MRSMSKSWLYRNSWFLTPMAPTLVVAAILVASLLGAASADGSPSAAESASDLPKLAPHQGGQLPPGTASARASRGLGGTLRGTTSQGLPSFIRVSGDGRRITRAIMRLRLRCSDGSSAVLRDSWFQVPISSRGKFADRFNDSSTQGGIRMQISDRFSGAFNRERSKVTARSRLVFRFHYPDGTGDTCDSGNVTLRAKK
jgi:hypothetical protein